MERSAIRESRSPIQPRISLRSIRATSMRHRPVFIPTPRHVGLPLVRLPQRGVRNAWAFHRARGAGCADTQSAHPAPCAGAQGSRCSKEQTAGPLSGSPPEGSPPRKQVLRLRSARGWTLRSAACPQELSLSLTRRLVRTDCRPDMHLDRPPVAPAFVALVPRLPDVPSVIRELLGPAS